MKSKRFLFGYVLTVFLVIFFSGACKVVKPEPGELKLKDAFKGKFYIGTALNTGQITGRDTASIRVVKAHFNSIVAENIMKSALIQPQEGQFSFDLADQFVQFGEQNKMHIHGHTLIWHSQAPRWFFTDNQGKNVSPEVLTQRMKTHISTVVGRYKGRVHSWDVVNEAIQDDGSWRKSKFYEILGEDFVKLAFQFAHEADPNAILYYNDYNMETPKKREGVVAMVKNLQKQGIKIDGIGMQGHASLKHPTIEEFEKSILAYSDLKVKVSITEMDINVLPTTWGNVGAEVSASFEYQQKNNPYTNGLPDSVTTAFNERYLSLFKLFVKHHDKIERVTVWGVNDGQSWLNGWPVRGRTNYPLLFDRNNQPKPVVKSILEAAQQK
ncbi:beta-xylanase [Adhaeribacter aerolatus]|uniref:Beta-xylanase n=1 Tax=Adhaeribacter aerolatus TaxID=670289 RepID=A0A512AU63_9BACT|nr:endo-1,4-beta-xylanase [Adhaeribacter aerolatus]GEO03251.1 beta-xylanase [Adhaeribacter aerolatus]